MVVEGLVLAGLIYGGYRLYKSSNTTSTTGGGKDNGGKVKDNVGIKKPLVPDVASEPSGAAWQTGYKQGQADRAAGEPENLNWGDAHFSDAKDKDQAQDGYNHGYAGLATPAAVAPTETYTRADFKKVVDALTARPDYRAVYTDPASGKTPEGIATEALRIWDTGTLTELVNMASSTRLAAFDTKMNLDTRRMLEDASRMTRFRAAEKSGAEGGSAASTLSTIDSAWATIDATYAAMGVGLPSKKAGGSYEGIDDVKDGTYTREKFSSTLSSTLAEPDLAEELKNLDSYGGKTGVEHHHAEKAYAAGMKAWDDGPTAARSGYAVDMYAAGRGVEPSLGAGGAVVWTKSGTGTSTTTPYAPATEAGLVDLAMAMRWRAISAAINEVEAEQARAGIDQTFGRIDLAAL
jgi:hypothetical protein